MKRIATYLIILLMVAGLCSACGAAPETAPAVTEIPVTAPPPATQPPATQPPATQPPATEPPETVPTEPPVLEVELPEPDNSDFVRVRDYIPDIFVELRYATEDNFTGQTIYPFQELWLRYGTVQKLARVQDALREQDLYLKVWDGFRPVSAQFALWEVCPNPTYVANPNGGYSSHSRGNTIDLTVVDAEGNELTMPTGFDDFSKKANRDYGDVSAEAAQNARLLERAMKDAGFSSIYSEWWHFVDTQSYAPEKVFQPIAQTLYTCSRAVALLDCNGQAFAYIPREETFPAVALDGSQILVEYRGVLGYVKADCVTPAA